MSVVKFDLSASYAFVLTTVFITNFFSAVIPIMPLVASFTFFLAYRVTKHNLLRYYTNVNDFKAYDSQMPFLASTILPSSAVLHCVSSSILLSDNYLSPYSIDLTDTARFDFIHRATLPNTFPLTILALVFIVVVSFLNSKKFYDTFAPDCLRNDNNLGELEDNPTWTETLEEVSKGGAITKAKERPLRQCRRSTIFLTS